jgi:CheY-like chemotaxis protein
MSPCSTLSSMKRPLILVIDDERVVRKVAAQMLENAGYAVLTAENGYQALELSTQFLCPIQLILCDVRMPGLGGVELREMFLKLRPETPVILMSGDISSGIVPDGIPCFSKPFTSSQLRERVREEIAQTTAIGDLAYTLTAESTSLPPS